MKRNPELFDYDGKLKKPPPAKKVAKKRQSPAPPEPPKPDPPVEPLPHSPHRLYPPYEPMVPFEDPTPHVKPLPMRLPEDPPTEPNPVAHSGIFEPIDPKVPLSDDIIPRPDSLYNAPYEPFNLYEPSDPVPPPITERALRFNLSDIYCERFKEPEGLDAPSDPMIDFDYDHFLNPVDVPCVRNTEPKELHGVSEPVCDPDFNQAIPTMPSPFVLPANVKVIRPKTATKRADIGVSAAMDEGSKDQMA